MPINTVIHEKRKEQGLTQEQVASYLGVTAPAVNKWEKGATYPDITLLAPLARLLKVDLNTLLCFQEGPSQQEIHYFCQEAAKLIQAGKLEEGFEMMEQKVQEYPHCTALIHSFALLGDGALILSELKAEEKRSYDDILVGWYRRVAESGDEKLKINAASMLACKYTMRQEYEKAQEMIDLMPEYTVLDKRICQVELWLNQKEHLQEAAALVQRKLMVTVMDMYGSFLRLVKIQLAAGLEEKAAKIAEISNALTGPLGLWEYYSHIAPLEVALFRKDISESLRLITALLSSADSNTWDSDSPLYDQLGLTETAQAAPQILKPLIANLQHGSEYDFLRDTEEFKDILKKYNS